MGLFGFNISLNRNKTKNAVAGKVAKERATNVIKKQVKRDVSYQIADIKLALNMVKNVDYPDRSKLFKIYDYILKDGHLISQIRTAIIKVQSEPWMLYKNNQPDEAASLLLRKKWFTKIIKAALEAEFYGFTLLELNDLDSTNFNVGSIVNIDREYVSIEKEWILIEGTINGSYLPYGEIKNEIDLIQFGDAENLGTLLECSYNAIWKFYARSDWSRANEKVGTPILSIIADTNNDKELDAIEARAANFGADGYMVNQKGDEVTLLERKSDNFHVTFKENIALANDEISKIINGQSVISDVKSFVGSAEVGERTMDDFTMARLQNIVDEMKENVMPYLINKGFSLEGYEFDYPRLKRERELRIKGIESPTDPKQPTTQTTTK